MNDTRLLQARECASAAITNIDKVVLWLIRDVLVILNDLAEDGLAPHDRVDVEQARAFALAAEQRATNAQILLENINKELADLEAS